MGIQGKRLLVLGGTSASLNVVKEAHKMGMYVIVTDMEESGVSKEIADESYRISTIDIEGLKKLIKEKNIDGVFCGPSEFNLVNVLNVCKAAGLPFYATREQWDICSNKANFKELCRSYGVPCVPEYGLTGELCEEALARIEYPVILKPVDGCSSKGISVCSSKDQVEDAFKKALSYSESKKVILEKYIQNKGVGVSARYIVSDGDVRLSLMGDRYVLDPVERSALITALIIYPSKYTKDYIEHVDAKVSRMFQGIGIQNASLFMQALPEAGNLYFHEMGLRLSGGLTYEITGPANGINDMQMMIRYAVGETFCTAEEKKRIDPYLGGKCAAIFSVAVKPGVIGKIEGLSEIFEKIDITSFSQYYQLGDSIDAHNIGTTMQFLARFKFFTDSRKKVKETVDFIQNTLRVTDTDGKDMIDRPFDTKRIE